MVGPAGREYIQKRGLVLTIIVYNCLRHLGQVMVRDLSLAVPERVDEGAVRLDLSSPMQMVPICLSSSSGSRQRRALSSVLNPAV